jgi:predicted 2-oxoglutarate/Fe(II)-dependent dioxygenase YbiX
MNLERYIQIYDDVLKPEAISSLIKWCNQQNFEEATVGNNRENKKIRDAKVLSLFNWSDKSKTKIHWCNLLKSIIWDAMKFYSKTNYTATNDLVMQQINDLSVLKYETGGHYKIHTDHYKTNPRMLSAILLLNNDYKGGELKFFSPLGEPMKEIEVAPGRLIIWPSTFLYPHKIEPVLEGTRYSVISWAL